MELLQVAITSVVSFLVLFFLAKIMGHRSIWGEDTPSKWQKSCPCFNAIAEYADI